MSNYNSNSGKTSAASGGIGFTGLLAVAFIVLKLLGKIDWSWWWVLAPIWIPVALAVLVLIIMVIVMLVRK